jgi:hypothetical protein
LEEVVGRAEAPELPVGEPVNEAASALSTVDVRLDRSGESLPVLGLHEPVETSDRGPVAEVSDIDVMLSMLAAEHRQSDPAAGIAERLSDRSTRVAVMVGGTALIGALVFLVLTILGALV